VRSDADGNRNRSLNRKLEISRAPTKTKSREPAYSQALNQNKIGQAVDVGVCISNNMFLKIRSV